MNDLITLTEPMNNNNIKNYVQKWFDFLQVSETSLSTYKRALRQFLYYVSDFKLDVSSFSAQDIREYVRYLAENPNKPLKPASINLYLAAVKNFYNWLEEEGISNNIAIRVKSIKTKHKYHKRHGISLAQAKALYESIDTSTIIGKRDYAMLLLLLTTGMRRIELNRANKSDIKEVFGKKVLFIQRKGDTEKVDYVKIEPQVDLAIQDYINARIDANDALFVSHTTNMPSNRIHIENITSIIKKRLRSIGIDIEGISTHSIRHFVAEELCRDGADITDIQRQFGHTSRDTTEIYAKTIQRSNDNLEARIVVKLFGQNTASDLT